MLCDWEGGIAVVMHCRLKWFIQLWAQGLSGGDEHPPTLFMGYGILYLYLMITASDEWLHECVLRELKLFWIGIFRLVNCCHIVFHRHFNEMADLEESRDEAGLRVFLFFRFRWF